MSRIFFRDMKPCCCFFSAVFNVVFILSCILMLKSLFHGCSIVRYVSVNVMCGAVIALLIESDSAWLNRSESEFTYCKSHQRKPYIIWISKALTIYAFLVVSVLKSHIPTSHNLMFNAKNNSGDRTWPCKKKWKIKLIIKTIISACAKLKTSQAKLWKCCELLVVFYSLFCVHCFKCKIIIEMKTTHKARNKVTLVIFISHFISLLSYSCELVYAY